MRVGKHATRNNGEPPRTAKENMKTTETTTKLIEHVTSECSRIDQERIFDDMLDESYSFEKVGGPFENMSPSRVLKEVDPTAYRCGMNDYFGTDDTYVEIEGELYEQREVEKARDEFVDQLDSQIADLEKEIETVEADEDCELSDLDDLKVKLATLVASEKEARTYTF